MGFDVWSSKIFFFPRYWRRESNYYGKEIYEKEIEIIRQNTTATYIRAHHHLIYRLTYDYVFTSSPVARRMSKRKKSPKSEFVSWRLKQSIYYKYKRFRFQPYELMSVMLQYVRLPNLPFDGLRSVVRFTFFRNLGSYGWMYFDFVVAFFFLLRRNSLFPLVLNRSHCESLLIVPLSHKQTIFPKLTVIFLFVLEMRIKIIMKWIV